MKKIEKLKEKIKAKPKLYKTLKVLEFLCNVCAYLIALFTILTLSIGSCSNSNTGSHNVVNKSANTIKYRGDYNGNNFLFSNSDFLSQEFLNGLIQYYYDNYGNNNDILPTSSNEGSFNINFTSTANICQIHYVQNGQIADNILPPYTIDIITINKYFYNSYHNPNNDYYSVYYEVSFRDSGGTDIITFSYYCLDSFNYNESAEVYDLWNIYISYSRQPVNFYNNYVYIAYRLNGETLLNDIFNSATNGYTKGYVTGFSNGYNTGKIDGYNEGYTIGSTAITNNPFDLIKKGFMAVASVLDIEIIPGLSLGIVIFAPIILGVLIVLFRMIRG